MYQIITPNLIFYKSQTLTKHPLLHTQTGSTHSAVFSDYSVTISSPFSCTYGLVSVYEFTINKLNFQSKPTFCNQYWLHVDYL